MTSRKAKKLYPWAKHPLDKEPLQKGKGMKGEAHMKLPKLTFFFSIAAFFVIFLGACGGSLPQQPTVASPTISQIPSQSTYSPKGFSFETSTPQDTEDWDTSEGGFKQPTTIETVSEKGSVGKALKIQSQLGGDNHDIFLHTETKVNMRNRSPEGYGDNPPPYNWKGKTVSLWVYFPRSFSGARANLYVVDIEQGKGQQGYQWINERYYMDLTPQNTNVWRPISLVVGQGSDDANFNPERISALGVRVEVPSNFHKTTDPFYVDSVQVPA